MATPGALAKKQAGTLAELNEKLDRVLKELAEIKALQEGTAKQETAKPSPKTPAKS